MERMPHDAPDPAYPTPIPWPEPCTSFSAASCDPRKTTRRYAVSARAAMGSQTCDGSRQMRMARRLKSGQVFVNNYGAGGGVELPFGGTGLSGHGREKGFEALYGFSSLKTVATLHG